MDYSPYAPPQHHDQNPYGGGYQQQYVYRPLGWRTTATIVALIGTVVLGFVQTGASLAFPGVLKNPAPENLGIILVLGVLGLAAGAVSIAAWVLFLVWMNLAAKNVRAFGQQGLAFTPGWCVGWWFIPIASLWKPYEAMREIWKASDPETVGPTASKPWMASFVPSTLIAWWIIYIANGFVALAIAIGNLDMSHGRATVTAGPLNLVTHALLGVAGAFLIVIMRQLAQRQEAAWLRLQSAPAHSPGPSAYGYPAPYGAPAPTANPYV